ncbi:hypothetical protein ACWOFR_08365 [Carnobacterium gallinarum]|uniref:hypothetical protein n=1 Tax=Carnobacterium gallinarum TaxID=2749 RepID=UPI000551A18B|nr:hypothetical protein [Carnobacterium gallinarum]
MKITYGNLKQSVQINDLVNLILPIKFSVFYQAAVIAASFSYANSTGTNFEEAKPLLKWQI